MPAVLFGSIGTLADTSELQREAFNEAFTEHGLDWNWDQKDYQRLLQESGGAQRISAYAQTRGQTVDAAAVHRTKSARFQEKLRNTPPAPRPGTLETIKRAKEDGHKLALVTTTSGENIAALTEALHPEIDLGSFDLIVDTSDVAQPKPDPAAYRFALERLGESPEGAIAIEDNVGGLQAARSAGVSCIAFPGENNVTHDFAAASGRVDALNYDQLRTHLAAA